MTRLIRLLLLGIMLVPIGLLIGCGSGGGDVVARVGGKDVTLEDFERFLKQNPLGYGTAQEEFEGKRMLLDSLVGHVLLTQGGYEKGIEKSPEVAQALNANRDRFLLDALYEEHVGKQVKVSETEIREIFSDLEYQIRLFHILVTDQDTAQALFERLKDGANFEQLAYEYSIDDRARRNRGDMGYFVRGTAPDDFEEVAFDLEVGELTPPFETRFGWHIIKMVDKRLNDARLEYAQMRPMIEQQIADYRRQQLTAAFFDSIRVAYPIIVDTAVAQYVIHKRNNLYPPEVVNRLPDYDFDDDQLDRDEKELLLATWEGGSITLMQYLLGVRSWFPPEERPAFDNYDSLASVIYTMKRVEIMVHVANQQNMVESEVFKENMRLFERYTVAEIMRNDSIVQPGPPSEQEMRDYYDINREEFLMPASVHLFEILVSDEMLAQRLAREIEDLDMFRRRAVQLTERAGMRVKAGDLGLVDELHFPLLFKAAKQVTIGTVGGPLAVRGKYSVIWPVRWIDETYLDFLTVKEDIKERVALAVRDAAVRQWQIDRRAVTDIEVFEDVIWSTINKELYTSAGGGASQP